MKLEDIEKFEKTLVQLESLHSEITILSKKKPDDPLNKFKLKIVNQILKESNEILGEKYLPFDDFTIFQEDELPTTSDVVLIITQYLSSFENLRKDNIKANYWMENGKQVKYYKYANNYYKYK